MEDIFVASEEKDLKKDLTEKEQKVDNSAEQDNIDPLNKVHLLSSFSENPDDISFENQETDEKILLFIRRARVLTLKWSLSAILLLLIPFIIFPFVNMKLLLLAIPLRFILFYLALYYLVVATYVFVNFITWYFNMALVTNLRIIDIDFSGLMSKDVAITKLSLVQDVSFTQIGVLRNLLNYGDILVQTAGSLDNFKFEGSPNPEKISRIIEGLIGKHGSI